MENKNWEKNYETKLTANSKRLCRLNVAVPDESIHTANKENRQGWPYSSVERMLDSHIESASLQKQDIVSRYMSYCREHTEWKDRDGRRSRCRNEIITIKIELEVGT